MQKCIVKQNTISLKQIPISERIPMTVLTEYKRETKIASCHFTD